MTTNIRKDTPIARYSGNISKNEQGSLRYCNEFAFKNVKRFYHIESPKDTIRAFHGHIKEEKYVYVVAGSIILCLVHLDNAASPSKNLAVKKIILTAKKPEIVFIPNGYANGLKILEENTHVIFYSTSTLKDSENDDYRYSYDYWGKEIWKI